MYLFIIIQIIFYLLLLLLADAGEIYNCMSKPRGEFVLSQTDWIFLISTFLLEELPAPNDSL